MLMMVMRMLLLYALMRNACHRHRHHHLWVFCCKKYHVLMCCLWPLNPGLMMMMMRSFSVEFCVSCWIFLFCFENFNFIFLKNPKMTPCCDSCRCVCLFVWNLLKNNHTLYNGNFSLLLRACFNFSKCENFTFDFVRYFFSN